MFGFLISCMPASVGVELRFSLFENIYAYHCPQTGSRTSAFLHPIYTVQISPLLHISHFDFNCLYQRFPTSFWPDNPPSILVDRWHPHRSWSKFKSATNVAWDQISNFCITSRKRERHPLDLRLTPQGVPTPQVGNSPSILWVSALTSTVYATATLVYGWNTYLIIVASVF